MKKHSLFILILMLIAMTHGFSQQQELSPEQDQLQQAPPDFIPFDKEPIVVKQVQPMYPDSARTVGLEGTVILKLWVTKEGKVKKTVVLKSDAQIFNQVASDAAMQWVFTPALLQKKPVDAWVALPFKFKLKDEPKGN